MITDSNAHQQFVNRKPPMNVSDFKSTLKTHNDDHKKFFGLTTYQDSFYGNKKSATKSIDTQLFAKQERKRRE